MSLDFSPKHSMIALSFQIVIKTPSFHLFILQPKNDY